MFTFCVAVMRTCAHIIIYIKGTDKSLLGADK